MTTQDTDDTDIDGDVEIRMPARDAARLIETLSSARYLTDDVRAHALHVADLARTALAAAGPRPAKVQTVALAGLNQAVETAGVNALMAGRDPAAEPVLVELRGAIYAITNVRSARLYMDSRTSAEFVAIVAADEPIVRCRGPRVPLTSAGGEG